MHEHASTNLYSNTLPEPAGSPPTHNPAAVEPEYYGETRVWQVDDTTGQITFHYVNPDGSVEPNQVPVTFWCPEYGSPESASSILVFVTANPALFLERWVQKWSYLLSDPSSCYVNEIVSFPIKYAFLLHLGCADARL
jgi:hypothetical protein